MTPEQFEERCKRLGATDVATILGVHPYRTDWETAAEKTGKLEQSSGSPATRAGNLFEPVVLDVAEQREGPLERSPVVWAENVGFPLASMLDSRVVASGVPCEAKTSGIVGPVWGQWGDEDTDEVPDVYLVQCCVQMLCTGADLALLYALLGGRGIVRYQIHRDESVLQQIVDVCGPWWERHVVQGIEPERTQPVPMDVVKRMRRTPNKTVAFDDGAAEMVYSWERMVAANNERKKLADDMKSAMLLKLGDAEAAVLPDGRTLTYLQQTRKGYYVDESVYRVPRITKG